MHVLQDAERFYSSWICTAQNSFPKGTGWLFAVPCRRIGEDPASAAQVVPR